jgi:predicted nucleotide-binding protein
MNTMPVRSELTLKRIPPNKDVFIVHGTDHTSLNELKTLIEGIGLNPIILYEQPSKGMTLIEKLEKYSNVGFAFIILTPDALGIGWTEGKQPFSKAVGNDNPSVEEVAKFLESVNFSGTFDRASQVFVDMFGLFKDRVRQDVILEFGYFVGRIGRNKVCCLLKGSIELPSDMNGICYFNFENSVSEVWERILKELRAAGYEVKPERVTSKFRT